MKVTLQDSKGLAKKCSKTHTGKGTNALLGVAGIYKAKARESVEFSRAFRIKKLYVMA
jgi:hypothetical protein